MKVNMTPNPLDVVTIHASQGDSEARQWEFELHNNGELIDTSEITEQMFFKAYKGGTEQLLPENTSTPTTSPFLGDIRYPQGLLSDQEFTYRQSPTEEDGLAKITDIKGNTLVWNQLLRNGNFESISGWEVVRGTPTTSNNILSYAVDVLGGGGLQNRIVQNISIPANHKVFYNLNINPPKAFSVIMNIGIEFVDKATTVPNTWNLCRGIRTLSSAMTDFRFGCPSTVGNMAVGDVIQFKNVMLVDLTKMGLDYITDPSEFTSIFSLPYYDYNAGTLLSFNGTGIKTVGKNLWDEQYESGYYDIADGSKKNSSVWVRCTTPIRVLPNTSYVFKSFGEYSGAFGYFLFYDGGMNLLSYIQQTGLIANSGQTITTPSNAIWMTFYMNVNRFNNGNVFSFSAMDSYEPYTSSTLSLPVSTYFPNGMKDVPDYTNGGKIYDEMTTNKADTRVGSVDLGSLNWTYDSTYTRFYSNGISQYAKKPISDANKANILSAIYNVLASNTLTFGTDNMVISLSTAGNIVLRNTSYTDATAFKSAMSGQYLYYELATPTETSFTTASLVTENAEIPLSNDDGTLIGKCTEQLSENPGFIDAKIKLSDEDGECYSNKLQLHVERSPQ